MRHNQLHSAPVARQQVGPGGLSGLSLCPEPLLRDHGRQMSPNRRMAAPCLTCHHEGVALSGRCGQGEAVPGGSRRGHLPKVVR